MVSLVVPAVVLKEVDADVLIVEEATEVSTVGVNVVSNVVTEVSNVVTTGVVETRVSDGVVAVWAVVINVVSTDVTTVVSTVVSTVSTVVLEVSTLVVEIIEVAS